MSKVFKIILGLSLLIAVQTEAAAGRFAHGAWKFIKRPTMILGVLGSGAMHADSKIKKEYYYNFDKKNALDQHKYEEINEQEEILLKRYGITLETDIASTIKQVKQEIRDIFTKNYGVQPDFIVFNHERVSPLSYINLKDKFGIIIGNNKLDSKQLLEHVVGHEYTHVKYNDVDNRIAFKSTLPVVTTTAYTVPRLAGRGRIVSLATGVLALVGHNLLSAQYSQFHEYRADRESSTNPIILEAGAKLLESSAFEEKEPVQITVTSKNGKRVHKFLKNTLYITRQFHTHPPSKERAKRLREQAAKLRAENKTE